MAEARLVLTKQASPATITPLILTERRLTDIFKEAPRCQATVFACPPPLLPSRACQRQVMSS